MAVVRLTEKQADELKDLIDTEINRIEDWVSGSGLDDFDADRIEASHRIDVLADILEELEVSR